MRILQIASILPVPGYIYQNDYVIVLSEYLKKHNQNIKIEFYRPSPFLPFVKTGKWKSRNLVRKMRKYMIGENIIHILPYIGIASNASLLAITSWLFASIVLLLKSKKLKNFDLSHAHYIFPDGLLAYFLMKKHNIPYIITLHSEQRIFEGRFSRKLALKVIQNADKLVSISPLMINYLKSNIGINNITFIAHGIDNSFFRLKESESELNNKIKVLSIGTLYWLKNFKRTIEAVSQLVKQYNIQLTIVGDGEDRELLENYVVEKGMKKNMLFIKHIPNNLLAKFMIDYDIFILPSFKETWGRVYIEAMAAGLPVILTKNTGVYGIINENEHALVVDPYSTKDITSKLLLLIEDANLRKTIAQNGRKLVQTFSWVNVAQLYSNIYTKYKN